MKISCHNVINSYYEFISYHVMNNEQTSENIFTYKKTQDQSNI